MASESEVWVQFATRIPKHLHRELKLHCVKSDVSVMDFVVKALEEKLHESPSGRASAVAPAPRRPSRKDAAALAVGPAPRRSAALLRAGAVPLSPVGRFDSARAGAARCQLAEDCVARRPSDVGRARCLRRRCRTVTIP